MSNMASEFALPKVECLHQETLYTTCGHVTVTITHGICNLTNQKSTCLNAQTTSAIKKSLCLRCKIMSSENISWTRATWRVLFLAAPNTHYEIDDHQALDNELKNSLGDRQTEFWKRASELDSLKARCENEISFLDFYQNNPYDTPEQREENIRSLINDYAVDYELWLAENHTWRNRGSRFLTPELLGKRRDELRCLANAWVRGEKALIELHDSIEKENWLCWVVDHERFLEIVESSPEGEICPICLDSLGTCSGFVVRTVCGHLFGVGCLAWWLVDHRDCPYCRRKFL